MRKQLCNVIASHLYDGAGGWHYDEDPEAALRETVEGGWPSVDVPGDRYPHQWTRYENVELDSEECDYVIAQVHAMEAESRRQRIRVQGASA